LTGVKTPLTHLFSVGPNYSCYFSPSIHRKQRWQLNGSGKKLVTRWESIESRRFCFLWDETRISPVENLTGWMHFSNKALCLKRRPAVEVQTKRSAH
jgi:hypothetical protein